jgi:uncharacterized cupredoxin-like copper-binding protein
MKRRAVAVVALATVLVVAYAVSALGRGDQASGTVRVNMSGNQNSGFRFTGVPRSINNGRVTFRFRNTSAAPIQHNFTVVRTFGQARAFRSGSVAPGASKSVTVSNLRPGVYVAVCTVFNGQHALNGMISTFQVQ